jgi:hypothetical protein
MRLLLRFGAGTLLLAAALVPQPEVAAAELHPLDPAAPAGVVSPQNTFENLVPLLDRESPAPSFVEGAPEVSSEEEEPPTPMPVDHDTMDHGATDHRTMSHGVPMAEAPR